MGCRDRLRSVRNWVLVWRSGAFDAEYYLRTYPDVANSRCNPLWHYCRYGWREGRNPNPSFNTRSYIAANPDVAAAGIDPFCHYIRFGRKEGRRLEVDNSSKTVKRVSAKQPPGKVPKPVPPLGLLKRVPCPVSSRTLDAEFFDEMKTRMRSALYGA